MKNFNKFFQKLIVALIAIMMIAFTAGSVFAPSFADDKTANEDSSSYGKHTTYTPTLEDDFADDVVIVTLKREYSGVNKEIDVQSFKTSSLTTINDINEQKQKGVIVDYSDFIVIDSITDLTYISNPDVKLVKNGYMQILKIVLNEKSKANVLKAIEEFEKLDCTYSK